MYGALKSSTIIWTPSCSMTRSLGRRLSSNAMPYCIPEQPPPLTKMRSASCGLPSLARSSLRWDCASGVSETTCCCSITLGILPPDLPSPAGGGWREVPGGGRSELSPAWSSAPSELEASLGFLLLGRGRGPGDELGQLLGPAGDRALGVGQHEDLALDRRLIRLGPVEVDLDRQLLLERADDVLFAHHRLGDLVVEREDDAPWNDVQHVGEDVQQ